MGRDGAIKAARGVALLTDEDQDVLDSSGGRRHGDEREREREGRERERERREKGRPRDAGGCGSEDRCARGVHASNQLSLLTHESGGPYRRGVSQPFTSRIAHTPTHSAMATTLAPVGAAAAAAASPPPAALSSSPPKHAAAPPPTSAPPPPGGPATAGFFRVVNEVRDFLAGEAAAEGWSAAGGCEPAGAGAGADASAADPARRARPGRPPPDWDWVAGQLLPLLQQYSGGRW